MILLLNYLPSTLLLGGWLALCKIFAHHLMFVKIVHHYLRSMLNCAIICMICYHRGVTAFSSSSSSRSLRCVLRLFWNTTLLWIVWCFGRFNVIKSIYLVKCLLLMLVLMLLSLRINDRLGIVCSLLLRLIINVLKLA